MRHFISNNTLTKPSYNHQNLKRILHIMQKLLLILTMSVTLLFSNSDLTELQYDGIEVQVTNPDGKTEMVDIEREITDNCEINVPMKTQMI